MSKRFTETAKWDDPWFVRLPAGKKLLWIYLCDRCDASGVIDFCAELAAVQTGLKVTPDSLKDFGGRLRELPSGKWQIIKFMPFQYGTVDASCPAHKPVIRLIKANGLDYPIRFPDNLSNRVSDNLSNRLQEKEKDKERDVPYQKQSYSQPRKLPAPIYDKLPPKREPTDEELANAQRIAKEEKEKLRLKLRQL